MGSDYQNKKRPAGYFNDLLMTDPGKLLRKYALSVSDNVENEQGKTLWPIRYHGSNDSWEWNKVSKGRKIAYVNLTKLPRRPNAQLNYAPGADDAVSVGGYFTETDGHVPVWFLPWIKSGDGGVVQLHIPDVATKPQVMNDEGKMVDNPGIFFTASITGCSIFFQGTAQSPRVFHAGGKTGHVDNPNLAAAHWWNMVTSNTFGGGNFSGGVDKRDYISDPHVKNGSSTARADAYETWLKNKYQNRLKVQMVQPWGCVLGFRTNGDWTFYLQENATIFYFEHVKNFLGQAKKNQVQNTMKGVARPLIVRQAFPFGPGNVWIPSQQPKLSFV
jgi:hypothetical protein